MPSLERPTGKTDEKTVRGHVGGRGAAGPGTVGAQALIARLGNLQ